MRFIEFMPLDAQGAWSDAQVVPAREIIEQIHAVFPLEAVGVTHTEPAARWRYLDGRGDVGVIASVTEPFCESCDRVRITAEGQFRTCLFALDEIDLASRTPRRSADSTRLISMSGSRPPSSVRWPASGPATASDRSISCDHHGR